MTKKVNYEVIKEFSQNGATYKPGETFKRPDDWQVDVAHTERWNMEKQGKDARATIFVFEVQEGFEQKRDGTTNKLVPVMVPKSAILPVK